MKYVHAGDLLLISDVPDDNRRDVEYFIAMNTRGSILVMTGDGYRLRCLASDAHKVINWLRERGAEEIQ